MKFLPEDSVSILERVREGALLVAAETIDNMLCPEELAGDTPIEKAFYAALCSYYEFGKHEYTDVVHIQADLHESWFTESPCFSILVRPQFPVGKYRVDFQIMAYCHPKGWRRLFVECDGHNFHERTKKQAAHDRSKDRALQMTGATVFRFTGSEIWNDPIGCADQVNSWAMSAWCRT